MNTIMHYCKTFHNHYKKIVLLLCLTLGSASHLYANPIDSLLLKGKQLFWSAEYAKAEKLFDEVLRMDPSKTEALYFKGYTMCQKNGFNIINATWDECEKVSHIFEKVLQLQPVYTGELLALTPQEKIMSEWSVLAEAYLYAGDVEKAKKAFAEAKKRGGLVPELYSFMKNMLLSCPTNAILITGGDMDTFFPLYFQVVEGLRTDITVLNVYLCHTPWFLSMITKKHSWQKQPLILPFTTQDLKDIDKMVARYQKPFELTLQKPGCTTNSDMTTFSITPITYTRGKPHISACDITLLHAAQLNPQRPFCIAPSVKDRKFTYRIYLNGELFDPITHLEKQGIVDVLSLCPTTDAAQIEKNKNLLTEVFTYDAIPNSTQIKYYECLVNEYISAFIHTATLMEKQGQHEQVKVLFRKLIELIPGVNYLEDKKQRDYIFSLAGKTGL